MHQLPDDICVFMRVTKRTQFKVANPTAEELGRVKGEVTQNFFSSGGKLPGLSCSLTFSGKQTSTVARARVCV